MLTLAHLLAWCQHVSANRHAWHQIVCQSAHFGVHTQFRKHGYTRNVSLLVWVYEYCRLLHTCFELSICVQVPMHNLLEELIELADLLGFAYAGWSWDRVKNTIKKRLSSRGHHNLHWVGSRITPRPRQPTWWMASKRALMDGIQKSRALKNVILAECIRISADHTITWTGIHLQMETQARQRQWEPRGQEEQDGLQG